MLKMLHHVAYRCKDAQGTVDFYTKMLGMRFTKAIVQENVPSIQLNDPHTHIFFEMDDGSFIAFFDLMSSEDAKDEDWAQHLALEVKDMDTLFAAKKRLEDAGHEVVGPTDHHFCQSIYFYDPSGHRLELTVKVEQEGERDEWAKKSYDILAEWNELKRSRQAATAAE